MLDKALSGLTDLLLGDSDDSAMIPSEYFKVLHDKWSVLETVHPAV
jgi:hypothetical protein